MEAHEIAQATFERVLKLYEKDDRIALTQEMQKLIAYAVKQQYIDYNMHVLIEPSDLGDGQMTHFLRAIICAQQNNWRKKLMTHSRIMRQWFRLNKVVREW
ncbi:hypothetical protein [Kurthia massiliensis]|uniref:hypothetical protein n=1 Tax=Kurthia massiliensis TaxID=1033739 RepID=UPI0002892DBC|nr:hypothetical protein [Kurthia massiliensis]